jgi:hypothetical protein
VEYKDLNQEAKDRALQDYVEHGQDYNWWEFTYEEWLEKLRAVGIDTDVDKIRFRGFCSQGDGASFIGTIDLRVFLETHDGLREQHQELYLSTVPFNKVELAEYALTLVRVGNYYYAHENTVTLDWELLDCDDFSENSAHLCDLMQAAEDGVLEQCRYYMREIYNDLELTDEYLRSEEAFIEAIESNGWEFTKSGKLK